MEAKELKRFLQRIATIDRRFVYLLVGLAVALPFFFPLRQRIRVSPPVRQVYDVVESLRPDGKPLLLSMDFDPSTAPELQPMAEAILRHGFARDVEVIVMTLSPTGVSLAEAIIHKVAGEFQRTYGGDYVFLGYKPGSGNVILQIGEEIRKLYPTDAAGTPVDDLPLMRSVHNYNDIGLVIALSGTGIVETWITYAVGRYGATYAMGVTAVMASGYYPYINTGQSKGLLGGMKGAAEYEQLLLDNHLASRLGDGSKGMNSQSMAHLLIITLILLGNIHYFVFHRRERRERGEHHTQR